MVFTNYIFRENKDFSSFTKGNTVGTTWIKFVFVWEVFHQYEFRVN